MEYCCQYQKKRKKICPLILSESLFALSQSDTSYSSLLTVVEILNFSQPTR